MKLIDKCDWRTPSKTYGIADALGDEIERANFDCGDRADAAGYIAREAGHRLARLVDLLHSKGVLTDADVLRLLDRHEAAPAPRATRVC